MSVPFVREEIPADHDPIREVNRIAFGRNEEAELVDRLRSTRLTVASLVAIDNHQIVGHIFFSELPIETEQGIIGEVSLAPMSVHPRYQRQGIGSALVRHGLELCWERGKAIVVVFGHPEYYPRFGFSARLAKNLQSPFSGDAWMALELEPGVLEQVKGTVRYPQGISQSSAIYPPNLPDGRSWTNL
jgi:putative acetyltransferase